MTSVTLPAAGATSAPSGACADPVRLLAHQGEAAHPFGQGLGLETFATDPVAGRDLPLAHGVAALAEEHAPDVAEPGVSPASPPSDPRECTGRFFIDDEVLAEEGVTDLSGYGGEDLVTDLFLDG